jgi:N-acetylglucosamine transport system substrate-binding protein
MTHTESQLQFVQGNAAMVFCGLWLENEMKNTTPPDFEMRAFTLPAVEGAKGNPRLFHGQGMEYLFVPRDGKNQDIAFEFARFLISPKAAPDMGRSIGVISPLEGATPRDTVSSAQQSALDIIEASQGLFNVRVYMLFPAWRTQVMGTAIAELLRGEITPQEFGRKMDAGIAVALADPDVIVPPFQSYDAAALGETP